MQGSAVASSSASGLMTPSQVASLPSSYTHHFHGWTGSNGACVGVSYNYDRISPSSGLMTIHCVTQPTSSDTHIILDVSALMSGLGLTWSAPSASYYSGVWSNTDGSDHGDRYDFGTCCLVNTDGTVELGRYYDTSGRWGSWELSNLGTSQYFAVTGLYVEE